MDPDYVRESAYMSILHCITAASSALLTNISPILISLPNALLILLHPPFCLGPLCLLVCASAAAAMSGGMGRQVRLQGRGRPNCRTRRRSADAGRVGECAATQQYCVLSGGVVAVDHSVHSKTDQMPRAPEHGHAAILIVSVCQVW
ncbi:hypothetical protein BD311DRAFT_769226 [Dichomitus squalens]|uniref:Uncharacterized protein n=1 Tax=Dichomitus squalens TaxID=114155 RepID=A0A4Q9M7R2_9APHY|nr:hypothetical protein BD311DRAFT_769226 [Dichomitus squalens]